MLHLFIFSIMKFESNIYYIWVGGSCDYAHKERAGGGAYIAELNGLIIDKFTIAEFETTEFRMMLKAMIHAMEKIAESFTSSTQIEFLSNVQYLQNFDKIPATSGDSNTANKDLIEKCIALKNKLQSNPTPIQVTIRILPYHKFSQQAEVHQMASDATRELRQSNER